MQEASRRTKPGFVLVVAVSGWLIGCGGVGHDTVTRPPKLQFTQAVYDFGRVPQGTTVNHAFSFVNEGGIDLSIDKLRTGCDCQARLSGPGLIRPAGGGSVLAVFDTSTVFGPQRRTITVYTNDPEQRALVLTLEGEVMLGVAADPAQLYVGAVHRGERVDQEVAVLIGDNAVHIESITTHGPQFTVHPLDLTDGRTGNGFGVVVLEDAPIGPFSQTVTVRTNSSEHARLDVRVSGIVEPDLTVSPPRLSFGAVNRAAAPERQVLIQNHRDAPVRITNVEWDEQVAQVEVETVREGFRYRLRAILSDDLKEDTVVGVVTLRTDHPTQGAIEVPLDAELKRRADQQPSGDDG